MSELQDALIRLLESRTSGEFYENRALLAEAVRESSVVTLAVLQELLPSLELQFPDQEADLAALRQHLELALEAVEDRDFPSFACTEARLAGSRRASLTLRMGHTRAALLRLARIANVQVSRERFVQMLTMHRWFMRTFSEYLEIVDDERLPQPEASGDRSPLRRALTRTFDSYEGFVKRGARKARAFLTRAMRPWFRVWARLPGTARPTQLDLEEPLLGTTRPAPFRLRLFACICLQKTRPTYTGHQLYYLG